MACAIKGVTTAAGSKVFVDTAAPATCDAAGFGALAFADEVKEVTNIGEFGGATNLVTHEPIGDQIVRKLKGNTNFGTLSLDMALVADDAGQLVMATVGAYDYTENVSFKITMNDQPSGGTNPTTFYFQGLVMTDKPVNIGAVNDIVNRIYNIEINGKIIEVPAA